MSKRKLLSILCAIVATASFFCISLTGCVENVVEKSDVCTLDGIKVNDVELAGFAKDKITYELEFPSGTTAIPAVTYKVSHASATAVLTLPNSLPGAAKIVVTAQDGVATKTYTIEFTVVGTETALSEVKANGTAVTDFAPVIRKYTAKLPATTTTAPVITAVAKDPLATVDIVNATAFPGVATITVTSADGSETDVFTVDCVPVFAGVTAATENKTLEDTREKIYTVYDSSEAVVATYASMYTAIDYSVNEGDVGFYVTKKDGDKESIVFINAEYYNDASKDMFWYYKDGVSLETYTEWRDTYWQDMKGKDFNCVYLSGEGFGIKQYYQSHAVAAISEQDDTAGVVPVYNVPQDFSMQAFAAVDRAPYSGITKADYKIELSKAKITPSINPDQKTNAQVGFVVADSYYQAYLGIQCDTETGNWYFYSADKEAKQAIAVDRNVCLMKSTWNDTGKYFVPNEDISISCEILTLADGDDTYIVDRIIVKFLETGRVFVKDYELSKLTACGTVRFFAGLNIEHTSGTQADFMNGSKFENLIVTEAVCTVYDEMLIEENYGNNFASLLSGEYDVLNSNPETAARFHTIIYNTAVVKTDFSTAGKDIYNFSYAPDSAKPAISPIFDELISLINAIPEIELLQASDKAKVDAALTAAEKFKDNQLIVFVLCEPELTIKLTLAELYFYPETLSLTLPNAYSYELFELAA